MTFIPSVYRDPNAVVGGRSFGKKLLSIGMKLEPIEPHDFSPFTKEGLWGFNIKNSF